MSPSSPLPLLFHREQALAAGLGRHQVAHRARTGRWVVLRRGWYCETARFDELAADDRHRLGLVATLRSRGGDHAGSHLSAALALGFPTPFAGPGPVTITSGDLRRSARRRERLVVQVATLPPRDVRQVVVRVRDESYVIPVTDAARTVADCLRHLPHEDGVAIADAAVRSGAVTVQEVAAVLDRQEPWPYLANGRSGLDRVDPRRESYLESFSLVRLAQRGIEAEPQVTITDRAGGFVARVDGWVDDAAVALEADGQAKYLLEAADPADVGSVVRSVRATLAAELERERRLRDLGVEVVRWGTAEALHRPERLAARVRAAVARGDRRQFAGSATPAPAVRFA